jgi:Lrp/AsnC family transcriptional regulator
MPIGRPRGHRLDQTDLILLRELAKNENRPLNELAGIAKLSYSPCRRRITRLYEEKYLSLKAVVSEERSRWTYVRFVILTLPINVQENIDRFVEGIQTIPEVISCDTITGIGDFLLRVAAPNADVFQKVRNKIVKIVPGSRSQTQEVVRAVKHYTLPVDALFGELPEV